MSVGRGFVFLFLLPGFIKVLWLCTSQLTSKLSSRVEMAGEVCLRLQSEERERNGKQVAEDWHPTSAVKCGHGLFAQPGAAGTALSVRQEHWRIYCRNTVKPPDERERRRSFKDRHFCPFRVEGRAEQCRAGGEDDLKPTFQPEGFGPFTPGWWEDEKS